MACTIHQKCSQHFKLPICGSNPTKRAGKIGTAKNDPRKRVKASASMVQRDESKEEIEAPYRPIQDVPVPSPTKPTFTTRHTHANEGILTQLTSELVAMHTGQNTHKSAASRHLPVLRRKKHFFFLYKKNSRVGIGQ